MHTQIFQWERNDAWQKHEKEMRKLRSVLPFNIIIWPRIVLLIMLSQTKTTQLSTVNLSWDTHTHYLMWAKYSDRTKMNQNKFTSTRKFSLCFFYVVMCTHNHRSTSTNDGQQSRTIWHTDWWHLSCIETLKFICFCVVRTSADNAVKLLTYTGHWVMVVCLCVCECRYTVVMWHGAWCILAVGIFTFVLSTESLLKGAPCPGLSC